MKTAEEALRFVERHGVVLEAGHGPVPSLAEAAAGAPISGSWWAHPKGRLIFALTRAVRNSEDVLVCRLLGGKITFVHRRLWPAWVRLSSAGKKADLAAIREEHTSSGRHRVVTLPFPRWAPPDVLEAARALSPEDALDRMARRSPGLRDLLTAAASRRRGSMRKGSGAGSSP